MHNLQRGDAANFESHANNHGNQGQVPHLPQNASMDGGQGAPGDPNASNQWSSD